MGVKIDWEAMFHNAFSHDRDDDVRFESPSLAAKRERAGAVERASSDNEQSRGTPRRRRRFEGLHSELDRRRAGERGPLALADDGARRPVTRAATKGDVDARAAAEKAYGFNAEDEDGEYCSRRYQSKSSPVSCGKKNYCPLPLIKGKKRSPARKRDPIPVEKMYSSQPSSADLSRKRQMVHDADPEEPARGKCQQIETASRRYPTRRRKQLWDSSSVYSQKVQDVVELDDDEVHRETSDIQKEPKIYYPSRDNPEVELTISDIKCLDPGEYVSSPVINYYIQYIKKTKFPSEDCREKFYIFNTYFYGKLEEALGRTGDFSKLRRWWKGVNILNRAYIMLPIHGAAHWSLVIICIPANENISGPIILHLDSLGIHDSTQILNTVERYLEEEWHHLKQNPSPDTSISETIWKDLPSNMHKVKVQVPQQSNEYDCGIFMLYYIERFIREAPERFTRDKLNMFSRSWFKPEDASGLRLRIKKLLHEEFESARLDDALSDAAASDGSDTEDNVKGGESGANAPSDSSKMVGEVGLELANTSKSKGIKAADSEEESGEAGEAGKSTEAVIVAESDDEASMEFGDAGKTKEGIEVAASEEASGGPADSIKSIEGINVADSEEESRESGEAGKSTEAVIVAESDDEASMEFGDAGKTKAGIEVVASEEAGGEPADSRNIEGTNVADSEEEIGESVDAGKSTEAIVVAESDDEAIVESGDAGKTEEGIEVATSEEASVELGNAGVIEEFIEVASPDEAGVESRYADKIMEGVSRAAALGEAPTSSKRHVEESTPCVPPEAVTFSDGVKGEEGATKVYSGSSKAKNQKGPIEIVSPRRPQKNKVATHKTPDVFCDSYDSSTDTKIEVVRVWRRPIAPQYKAVLFCINLEE